MLREARIDRRVKQEGLAGSIGMHPTHLSDIELGKKDVRYSTVLRIVAGLDLTVDELFAHYGAQPSRRTGD